MSTPGIQPFGLHMGRARGKTSVSEYHQHHSQRHGHTMQHTRHCSLICGSIEQKNIFNMGANDTFELKK
jgi:hypothetical protein